MQITGIDKTRSTRRQIAFQTDTILTNAIFKKFKQNLTDGVAGAVSISEDGILFVNIDALRTAFPHIQETLSDAARVIEQEEESRINTAQLAEDSRLAFLESLSKQIGVELK